MEEILFRTTNTFHVTFFWRLNNQNVHTVLCFLLFLFFQSSPRKFKHFHIFLLCLTRVQLQLGQFMIVKNLGHQLLWSFRSRDKHLAHQLSGSITWCKWGTQYLGLDTMRNNGWGTKCLGQNTTKNSKWGTPISPSAGAMMWRKIIWVRVWQVKAVCELKIKTDCENT